MIKALKEKLILSLMERKKKKTAFDAVAAELYELAPKADIHQNNSHFFTASNVSGETLSIRLGMRNNSDYEVFVLFRTADGRFFVHEKDHYRPQECPVRFQCLEVASKWRVSFDGLLKEVGSSKTFEASVDVEFTASYPIYDFFYHADRFNGMASSIAREKWDKAFFASLSKNDQRHYEQPGRIVGTVKLASETFDIDLCCVRDHSFGRREWDMMNDHIWLLGITQDNKVLCFSIVNYPTMKRIYSGYTDFFTGRLETLRDYDILDYDASNGLGPERLKLRCHFSDNRALELEVHRDSNVKCIFDGGNYIFQEGLGNFTINGIAGRGTIEYGFNGDSSRWEGYSKLD